MSSIKRIDPRRPFRITPAGLRRIVLGETGIAASDATQADASHQAKFKPLRPRSNTNGWNMAIVHANRGRLDEHARQVIAAAAILATPETGMLAVVLGELQDNLASLGADRVAVFPVFDTSRLQPENELATVEALIEAYKPAHVFLADNAAGDGDLGRRLIAAHSDNWAVHVTEIDAKHVAAPWSGGARMAEAAVPRFVLLDVGAVDTALPFIGAAELIPAVELSATKQSQTRFRDLGLEAMDASAIALEEADVIVSAGNGVRNVDTLQALAATLGASVGASRVAVDEGKFSRDKQIGATGKTVSASTYFAVGISGAVQHLQGIKDCRHVIAVNRDAGAPIVKRADLTIVGDAEEVMQALITRIAQARAQREIPEAT
jgi:electron transfer flavoprotein alpha subunit